MTNKLLLALALFSSSIALAEDRVGHFDQVQVFNGSQSVNLKSPGGLSTWNMTLPANDGNAGQALTTDGSGLTSWTGPFALAAGADFYLASEGTYPDHGFLFVESGNDTGWESPSDGVMYERANSLIGSKWDSNGISEMRGVPILFPNGQGAANSTLINDGSGILAWLPAPFGGSSVTVDPDDIGSGSEHTVTLNVNPSNDTEENWTNLVVASANGTDDAGFEVGSPTGGGSVTALHVAADNNHANSFGSLSAITVNSQLGNGTDTKFGRNYYMFQGGLSVLSGMTVEGIDGVNYTLTGAAGSHFGNTRGLFVGGTIDDVQGFTGIENAVTLGTMNGNYFGLSNNLNFTHAKQGLFQLHAGYSGGNADGQVITLDVSGTIGNSASYTTINDNTNIDTMDASSLARGLGVGHNFGVVGGYTLLDVHYDADEFTNTSVDLFNDGSHIALAHSLTQANWHPAVDSMDGTWKGLMVNPHVLSGAGMQPLIINPTVDATTSSNDKMVSIQPTYGSIGSPVATDVTLLELDCANVHTSGTCTPLQLSKLNVVGGYTPVTNVMGNPSSVNQLITQFNVPASATISTSDSLGVNTAALINLGAGATLTSGGLGVGVASLALPNVLNLGAGSSIDRVHGALFANVLSGGTGTVEELVGMRTLVVPDGSTTVTKYIGAKLDMSAGDPATTSYGVYEVGADYNYFDGWVGIGTNTPAANLDVIGSVKITDGSQGAGKVLTSDAAGLATWSTPTGGSSQYVPIAASCASAVVLDGTTTLDLASGGRMIQFIKGTSGGANMSGASPELSPGDTVGQERAIYGCDDTDVVVFVGDSTLLLKNGDYTATSTSILLLLWDGAKWVQTDQLPPSISITDSALRDAGNQSSVAWNDRNLISSDAALSLDWENRSGNDATSGLSLDWGNRDLLDPTGVIAVDWSGRSLVGPGNNQVAYWTDSGVGIGTSTPSTLLDVEGAGFLPVARFVYSDNFAAGVLVQTTDTSSGLPGITVETSGTGAGLNLIQTTTKDARVSITGGGSGIKDWDLVSAGSDNAFAVGDFYLHNATDDTVPLLIDTMGNVGIGSTAPTTRLEVTGTTHITDAGANGGNVPHSCTTRSSSAGTATVACNAGEIATGGGVDCGNTALFISKDVFTGGPPSTGREGSCTSLLSVVTNATIVVSASCCQY